MFDDFFLFKFFFIFLFFFSLFFFFFRAAPMAYGDSQARGPIEATAAGLHHSHGNANQSLICHLHHSSRQCWILPLSEARDRTCILMDASQIHFLWATMGTPQVLFFSGFRNTSTLIIVFNWEVVRIHDKQPNGLEVPEMTNESPLPSPPSPAWRHLSRTMYILPEKS